MAPKIVRHSFRVEVEPRHPGDFGFASIGGITQSEADWQRDCEEIARQIRRHVEGIAPHGVRVKWDADRLCEHCGSDWTEDSQTYNGGCCLRDDDNNPEAEQASASSSPQ